VKPRIYVETSVISYLAARPAQSAEVAGRQAATSRFWEARHQFELYVSPAVVEEARGGDEQAMVLRMTLLDELPLLEPRPEVAALAKLLLDGSVFPEKAAQDAVHIAYAAWYRLDAIVSWNFRHIASAWARQRIEHALRELGYPELVIATPEEIPQEE